MWDKTLREQHAIRQELMRGLENPEMREVLWMKHYWKGADEESDQKLTFDEVEKLCRSLYINSSREDLERLFKVRFCCRLLPRIPINVSILASGCSETSISRFQ